jgi:hypothetical protein
MLRLDRNKDAAELARFNPDAAFSCRVDSWLCLFSIGLLIETGFGFSGNT